MARVLVVEDEPSVKALEGSLEEEGHEVIRPGRAAAALTGARDVDLVILDLDIPEVHGVDAIRDLRRRSSVPVIVISETSEEMQKVAALDAGADDYITKPFGLRELRARVRASLRRALPGEAEAPVLRFGGLEIDRARRVVRREGEPLHLTPTEYSILNALVTHPGRLLSHKWLLQRVWGPSYQEESHYLREFVRSLRRKLGDDATAPRLIATERGVGYRWIAQADPSPDDMNDDPPPMGDERRPMAEAPVSSGPPIADPDQSRTRDPGLTEQRSSEQIREEIAHRSEQGRIGA